ncbi:alcohol dehydrogenase (cytochrome c) [Azospirillum fermentarium]|uniref:methanol/ethanol family PQQ-dependent dehydrogenase n=1 Tax=Azospirillum fermentarium TaxID=1233114 RepID=UPI002225D894|nr:methanol/ethanol family PQQ-dependent dehydrogenase [Azospirillum fermentarium]MCW2244780.1 alcohol dehydrogenase (cytochrome c) [Azospirillum fermentarium]
MTSHVSTLFPRRLRRSVAGLALAAAAAAFLPAAGVQAGNVSWEDIANDAKTTKDVLMYGMGLDAKRYSPLKQISADNVSRLVPAWSFSFGDEKQRGQETQALVHDGVIYITASYSRLFAVDAKTGRKLWSYTHRLPDDIRPCCDVVNRGAAIYGDKVFLGTLDASIVALNKDTGKVVWRKKFAEHKAGYTMTGAPTIVKDQKTGKVLLIHGSSGDEFGVVGRLFARDPDTGEEIWMRPMVEGHMGRLNGKDSTVTGNVEAPSWPRDKDGKFVEAWNHGGGAPWQSATFDTETNTIVIGAGNPAPWNGWARSPGDSLFTSGQAYVDPTTGELKGFYQHTPNDTWDFSGNNELILFDFKDAQGKVTKAAAHADRNGFFFITDRNKLAASGGEINRPTSLIAAYPFVDGITWAKGFDTKTGRPIEVAGQRPPLPEPGQERGKAVEVSPPFLGGKNWNPMAYSEDTGLFYIPANHWKEDYWTEQVHYKEGAAYLGMGFRIHKLFNDHVGTLRALDPKTGKIAWEHKEELPLWAGVMTTAGNLVFTGTGDGYLKAFDAKTGKELWSFQTGSGVVSCPITWEMDGVQYVGIASGYGGAVPLWGGDMADLTTRVSQGGSFWVFKLSDTKVSSTN